ncbi:MAG TPA: hypothetical protein VIK81_04470 [Patescibacteria group bacterium]
MVENKEHRFGECEICGSDPKVINIIPKHQENGSLITLACENCALDAGMYCVNHARPHMGFEDGTSACKFCIDDDVEERGSKLGSQFYHEVEKSSKKDEILEFVGIWDEFVTAITLESSHKVMGRALITGAMRRKITPEEMIKGTLENGPAFLLPGSSGF